MGLEPTPGPWQGPVLPLYYGRPNQRNFNTSAFRRQDPSRIEAERSGLANTPSDLGFPGQVILGACKTMGSADLKDAGGLYDRRLSLPLSKFGGLFPVRVHASKSLSVLVKHSHLPVFVLPPPIFPERSAFSCGFCFGHDLNISMTIRARKYLFGQYFARNRIILYYRVGCNNERQVTGNSAIRPRIPGCMAQTFL